jgi:hypothetical protein
MDLEDEAHVCLYVYQKEVNDKLNLQCNDSLMYLLPCYFLFNSSLNMLYFVSY